jgi:hypothetical protein
LYRPTGQHVDFIVNAGFEPDLTKPEPANVVAWSEGPLNEYPPSSWFAPVSSNTPIPVPIPPGDTLENRVALLELQMSQQQAINQGLQSQITELAKQIADLHQLFVAKPLPEYEGRGSVGFFGGSFTVISRPRS